MFAPPFPKKKSPADLRKNETKWLLGSFDNNAQDLPANFRLSQLAYRFERCDSHASVSPSRLVEKEIH
jgi:hypothetical protein